MTVTLNELLMLAGRLDDSSGFDTSRERFRRFLVEHVTTAQVARTLIEQCQHSPGDQHHRALQDIVVVLGRCLGFEPRFGSYLPAAGTFKPDGHWHSRRLDVVLEIRTDQTEPTDLDTLSRSVSDLVAASHRGIADRALGLCVLTPLYASREELQENQTSSHPVSSVRIVTLRSLLYLAEMVSTRRLGHEEVVRLLASGLELDFLVELLERAAVDAGTDESSHRSARSGIQAGTSFWLAAIGGDQGATPKQVVELVIGKRHILGVGGNGTPQNAAQPGDRICFYIPGLGVVGHGQVQSIVDGDIGIRGAHRYSQLLRLGASMLHMTTPVSLEEEMLLRVRAVRASRDKAAHSLTRISREEFEALTTVRRLEARRTGDEAPVASSGTDSEASELPVSVGDSRSHE
jgi:hypothetical protein